ncbi:hypothetical protein C6501_00925 [Candidatus Poribacteria bacterium]|nr:MAG: hypothetical protein C6501_00925 [Candidatus Poribacteria bacterium]
MNKLHFGDNLEILQKMDDESVDLICTDPPINTRRNYNIFFPDSANSIWTWDKAAEDTRVDIEIKAANSKTYKTLNECLRGYDIMLRNSDSAMRAYLAFMGPRLAEMHRILSKTGSIFLHCDPSASHYLKCMMDAIFGAENFKNEIVWGYKGPSHEKRWFPRRHDIILFYGKSKDSYFNPDEARVPFTRRITGTGKNSLLKGSRTLDKVIALEEAYSDQGKLIEDYWTDIYGGENMLKLERLDYPNQKPRRLYERIIKASSNEGDLVLDPFCGGGTTLDAAQALKRYWIGIDITILALDPIEYRLKDRYGLKPSKDYKIQGYPKNMQDVKKLARDKTKHNEFSHWAVTRLGLTPSKDVDNNGHPRLWTLKDKKKSDLRILAEVKADKPTPEQIRALQKPMEDNKADIGVLITLESVTSDIHEIAEKMGKFEYKGLTYPRLQFWQITDAYFDDPETIYNDLQLPGMWRVRPTKKSGRHFSTEQMKLDFE